MKKKRIAALLLALIMILGLSACGKKSEGPLKEIEKFDVKSFELSLNGVKITDADMKDYGIYEAVVTSTNTTGTTTTVKYQGYRLVDMLKAAGLNEAYVYVNAAADDGYSVELTDVEKWDNIMIAMTKDGDEFKKAPWFIPCDSETTGDFLKACSTIVVNTKNEKPEIKKEEAKSEPGKPEKKDKTGSVKFEDFVLKIDGKEYTNKDFEGLNVYKVTVNVVNSKGVQSEATYAGYVLSDVLSKYGVKGYTKVTAVGSDDKVCELTPAQIASEYTIIAIEKDKKTGENGTVWVAPCEETSSGSYVKLVCEIKTEK